jgi:hypothetical protein
VVILVVGCLLANAFVVLDGEGWANSTHHLHYIGLAMQLYYVKHDQLPPAVVRDKEGRPLYSWRVLLLPYLDMEDRYREFKLDEPWDSPHNKKLLDYTPWCYRPARGANDGPGLTRYQVLVGPGTAFEKEGQQWADFPDGRENTLLVVEAGEPVPWSKPADLAYDPARPLPPLGGVFTKPVHFFGFEVGRREGFATAFADGTIRFLDARTEEATQRALITRNGGEPVDVSKLEL